MRNLYPMNFLRKENTMYFRTKVSLLMLALFIGVGALSMNVQPAEAASLADLQQIIDQLKDKISGLQKRLESVRQGEKDPYFLDPSKLSASVSSALPTGGCSDTDGGIEKYIQGTACRPLTVGTGTFCATDACVSSSDSVKRGYLKEYFCRRGKIFSKKIFCKDGCNDGACINIEESNEPYCSAIGKKNEGWYQNGKRIIRQNCAGCNAICMYSDTDSEGWYSSCDNELIKLEECAEAITPAVGIWLFEEGSGTTLNDESGHGNHGTFSGSTTPVFPDGVYAGTKALEFDGVDDYVGVDGVSDDIAFGDLSVELWFKLSAAFDGSGSCVHQYLFESAGGIANTTNNVELYLDKLDGTLTFKTSRYPLIWCWTSQNTWEADTWYHVVGTFDNTHNGAKIFVNGTQDGSTGDTGRGTTPGTTARIGTRHNNTLNFNGVIDNVKVYNYALSAAEVQEHFSN